MLYIHFLFFNCVGKTLDPPVRNEINSFRNAFRRRNIKTEVIFRSQINARAAEFTRKDAVGFVKNYRSAALRTLLFDLKVRAVHRIYYNRLIQVNFQSRTWSMS